MICHIPDYLVARPREDDVPEILVSGDAKDLDEIKDLMIEGSYLYKIVRGRK